MAPLKIQLQASLTANADEPNKLGMNVQLPVQAILDALIKCGEEQEASAQSSEAVPKLRVNTGFGASRLRLSPGTGLKRCRSPSFLELPESAADEEVTEMKREIMPFGSRLKKPKSASPALAPQASPAFGPVLGAAVLGLKPNRVTPQMPELEL